MVVDAPADGAKEAVIAEAGFGRSYLALPIVEVEGSDDLVERLKATYGVEWILPAMKAGPNVGRIANGLDMMMSLAQVHAMGMPLDGTYGGRRSGDELGYPVLLLGEEGWSIDYETGIDWVAPPAITPVLNMSLGTGPSNYPHSGNDIVNLATAAASDHMVVVMAAGNCGWLASGESMSAWAEAPWVVSVGATSDRAGTMLAEYSSRGVPDQPDSGPDGEYSDQLHGTSFAAPRVTGTIQFAAAALLQLGRAVEVGIRGREGGVPLVGRGMIDDFGDEMFHGFDPARNRSTASAFSGHRQFTPEHKWVGRSRTRASGRSHSSAGENRPRPIGH